jgi:hypothetical protein
VRKYVTMKAYKMVEGDDPCILTERRVVLVIIQVALCSSTGLSIVCSTEDFRNFPYILQGYDIIVSGYRQRPLPTANIHTKL